ncbi:MAG: rRNA maturation RNase YbeY [Candidatus Zixiibacteriota bacterium]|nr:MAG: rRNA maturation RNase YbeY [candidate division Zixibacteria bacterium]
MKLVIHKETKVRLPAKKIKELFDMLMEEEADPASTCSVQLIFTTDAKIKELNSYYRNKEVATDVLSFNIDKMNEPKGVFGEIYISVPFAKKQAKSYKATLSEELIRLITHGLLHLFGYDHIKPDEEKIMNVREEYFWDCLYGEN